MHRGRKGRKNALLWRTLNARQRGSCFMNMKVVSQKLYFRDSDLVMCWVSSRV